MTQEAFIAILDEEGYSYKIEGDKIVVTHNGYVDLRSLTSLPPGVEFRNGGDVDLRSLIGRQFNYWNGNIKRIASKRLLNVMIKQGVFI